MKTTVPIKEAQADLTKLVRSGEIITLIRNGQPVAVLMPYERMEMMLETMEILANPKAMKAIRDYEAGKSKGMSLRKFEKELDALERKR